jgi:hypothetical protein
VRSHLIAPLLVVQVRQLRWMGIYTQLLHSFQVGGTWRRGES